MYRVLMKLTAVKSGQVQSLPLVALSTGQASNDLFYMMATPTIQKIGSCVPIA